MQESAREAILLLNVGSPASPDRASVRRYLRQFLGDRRVMDLPVLLRFLVLHLFILPFRPARSAEAYRKIWSEKGSPLIAHTLALGRSLQARLNEKSPGRYTVKVAMRYGEPSLARAIRELDGLGITRIHALPLFPQYASATTGSVLEELYRLAGRGLRVPSLRVVDPMEYLNGFVDAMAAKVKETVGRHMGAGGEHPEHFLFTFHGLPERQIRNGDLSARCLVREGCCDRIDAGNRFCYRARAMETARLLAERLTLPEGRWSVSFQSRMGRMPWIGPHTEDLLASLPESGVRSLAVLAPSFAADCLETLEEIAMRGRERFLSAGGERFLYIPALNEDPRWIDALANLFAV